MISFNVTSIFHRLFEGPTVVTGYKKKGKKNDGTNSRKYGGGKIYKYSRNYYIVCMYKNKKNRDMTASDEFMSTYGRKIVLVHST